MCGRKVFVVDIEASAFGGWPIEIGWSLVGSGTYRSFLIKPDRSWDLGLWDEMAEEVHGISIKMLHRDGHSIDDVVNEFLKDVDGAILISDAPEFDQAWLDKLLSASSLFTMKGRNNSIIQSIRSIYPLFIFDESENKKTHRAGHDAVKLSNSFQLFN